MIPQGRGRGPGSSNRGRGRINIIIQNGRGRLIAENVNSTVSSSSSVTSNKNDPLYGEFIEILKTKKGVSSNDIPSYAKIIKEENDDSSKAT